ncbi:MAG: hypothetical protein JNL21_34955 [Myxococcales bacterium]|nr:hypothetical protein [Myxococcales bacterium]
MAQAALDRSYVDTSCPKSVRAPKVEAPDEPVVADGRLRDLVFVPFRGPRMSIQWAIDVDSRVYHLRNVFAVQLDYLDDGTVVAEQQRLGVSGHGRSVAEALSEFALAFDGMWRSLHEPGAELTRHAQMIRSRLDAVVERVEDR